MPRATWKDVVLAESSATKIVEGNHYFPPDAISWEHLHPSEHRSVCPWKGDASYYDIVIDGETNPAAAWYYPAPKPAAAELTGYVAFWNGVSIERSLGEPSTWSKVRHWFKHRDSDDAAAAA